MTNTNKLLKDLTMELVKEFKIQFKEDTEKVIGKALTDDAGNYFLRKALVDELVNQLTDKLVEPKKIGFNVEQVEEITVNEETPTGTIAVDYMVYLSFFNIFSIKAEDYLYFQKVPCDIELKDLGVYLINWNGHEYLAIYNDHIRRFILKEDDFLLNKYNNMPSVKSVKVVGRLIKKETK